MELYGCIYVMTCINYFIVILLVLEVDIIFIILPSGWFESLLVSRYQTRLWSTEKEQK